jgi:hypothetical protein
VIKINYQSTMETETRIQRFIAADHWQAMLDAWTPHAMLASSMSRPDQLEVKHAAAASPFPPSSPLHTHQG